MKKKWGICAAAGVMTGLLQILGIFLAGRDAGQAVGNMDFLLKAMLAGGLWAVGSGGFYALAAWIGRKMFGKSAVQNPDASSTAFMGAGIWKNPFFYQLLILLCWLPCYLAYFPAIYSYDGEPQLIQYTTGVFDNHHPLLHTLILGWCYDLGQFLQIKGIALDGMAIYAFGQMLLLSGAFAYGIRFFLHRGCPRWSILLVTAWLGLFPVHPIMAVTTTKDTFFTVFLVTALVMLLEILQEGKLLGKVHSIGFFLVLLNMMLFRRNGFYMAAGMVLGEALALCASLWRRRRSTEKYICQAALNAVRSLYGPLLALTAGAVIAFGGCETGLLHLTGADPGEAAEALSVPLQQIARTFKSNEADMTEEELEAIYEYVPRDGLSNYRPFISDGVKMYFDNEKFGEEPAGFIQIWAKLFKRFPGSYVTAFLYNTMGSWYLDDVSHTQVYADWWRNRTGYMITDAIPVFALGHMKKENLMPEVRSCYEAVATDCIHQKCLITRVLFSPAFYCLSTVYLGLALLVSGRKRYLIPYTALLVYLVTVIAGPCILVRYIYPFMAAAPWMVAMLFLPLSPKSAGRRKN